MSKIKQVKKCTVCGRIISKKGTRDFCSNTCKILKERANKIFNERLEKVDTDCFKNPTALAKYLRKIWDELKGNCKYSKLPMSLKTGQPDVVSVDRINAADSKQIKRLKELEDNARNEKERKKLRKENNKYYKYTKGNITLCCFRYNIMKQQSDENELAGMSLNYLKAHYSSIESIMAILKNLENEISNISGISDEAKENAIKEGRIQRYGTEEIE